ncbi:bifunctional metallophosphatase/5'-nucleotidase [Schaalia turicensis]|uniref:bifunctional metallophosphatase/5'-nucleotidase n=1 Tax=Schaalia turicensis TaxID=131111 RepID=UPI003FA4691A
MRTRTKALISGCASAVLVLVPLAAQAAPNAEVPESPAKTEESVSPVLSEDNVLPVAPESGKPDTPAEEKSDSGALVTSSETESAPQPARAGGDIVMLNLYTLTDVHGHIEQVKDKSGKVTEAGLSAMSCYLKKARTDNPNSSFTLLGDNIGASPYTSGSLKDNPTIAALNTLDPLASTIGNHEFDMGQAVFKQRVDGSNPAEYVQVGFPYLGANVQGMGTWDSGTKPYLGDYKVWDSPAGVKVAFIGAIAEDVPSKLSPGVTDGLTFTNPIEKINNLAASLKSDGDAQVVIAMLDDDVKNNYPKVSADVDGIMGGDTHVPYEFDKVDSAEKLDSQNSLLAGVASGSYTDNLGLIRISYDTANNKVVKADAQIISAATVADCGDDAVTQAIVDDAVSKSEQAGNRVVGTGYQQRFNRGVFAAPDKDPVAGSNRGIESSLGDFVADMFKDKITTTSGKGVDIGVVVAGDLRADLVPNEAGEITYKQTYDVLPWSNELGYVTLTGADFKLALEQQWKALSEQNSRPLLKLNLSSNVHYTYDPLAEVGHRITSVTINGEPLNDTTEYTIGSNSYILTGGDSFDAFKKGAFMNSGYLDRDKFNEYLGEHSNKNAAPRALKSSIGITLPEGPVENGATVDIALRGLSFSEGPSITKKVRVAIGGEASEENVDNSLVEAHSSDESSVITTDGAGRATVSVVANGACEGKESGEIVATPVVVETDFGPVVEASAGLTIPVKCGDVPAPASKPHKQLAKTGANDLPALLGTVLLGAGTMLVLARKRH